MRKKIIIVVLMTLLIGSMSASAIKLEITNFKDPVPTIDGIYNTVYGHGEQINSGYARCRYDARVRNKLNQEVSIVFDWDDGTTDTSQVISSNTVLYYPHEYENGRTYNIKARYSIYDSWSESCEFVVYDHCDLDIVELEPDPSSFRPGATIDVVATVKNVGSIPSSQTTTLQFYDGYPEDSGTSEIEGPKSIGILARDETTTVRITDFKWWKDEYTHSIWVILDEIPNERTSLNNREDGHFTATKSRNHAILLTNPLFVRLVDNFPTVKTLLKNIF